MCRTRGHYPRKDERCSDVHIYVNPFYDCKLIFCWILKTKRGERRKFQICSTVQGTRNAKMGKTKGRYEHIKFNRADTHQQDQHVQLAGQQIWTFLIWYSLGKICCFPVDVFVVSPRSVWLWWRSLLWFLYGFPLNDGIIHSTVSNDVKGSHEKHFPNTFPKYTKHYKQKRFRNVAVTSLHPLFLALDVICPEILHARTRTCLGKYRARLRYFQSNVAVRLAANMVVSGPFWGIGNNV